MTGIMVESMVQSFTREIKGNWEFELFWLSLTVLCFLKAVGLDALQMYSWILLEQKSFFISVKGVGTAVNASGFLLAPDQSEGNQTPEDQMFDPSEESLFSVMTLLQWDEEKVPHNDVFIYCSKFQPNN